MKIMHVIHKLDIGGAQTLVKNYMLNFDNKKNDAVLLCLNHEDSSPYEKELSNRGIRVIYAQDYSLFKRRKNGIAKIINRYYRYIIVKRIINEQSPDIIHTHLAVNRFIKFAKPKRGTKLFYTVHTEPRAIWQANKKNGRVELRAARWLVDNYNMKFFVLHEKMKKKIDEMFGVDDSIILNNGIDVVKIKNPKSSTQMREEFGIPKDAFIMGHIGRFLRVKNQTFLVDVFIEVAKKNGKAFLLMIGDGPEKKMIVDKLNNARLNDRYLILANRDDVPSLLNMMDVFIFPSLYEGIPLSLIEAQIAKKPCFVSDGVNEHAIMSNLATRIPLEQGALTWSQVILSYRTPKKIIVDEDSWDIKKETKRLEQIYLDVLFDGKKSYNCKCKEKK